MIETEIADYEKETADELTKWMNSQTAEKFITMIQEHVSLYQVEEAIARLEMINKPGYVDVAERHAERVAEHMAVLKWFKFYASETPKKVTVTHGQ